MLSLRPIDISQITSWYLDFQKKSRCFEAPPEGASILGIYRGDNLIGYFILVQYTSGVLEINQGYLCKEARHKNISKIAMNLLEDKAKEIGINKIVLGTNRAAGSYIQFMKSMNYSIIKAIFCKEL